MPGIQVLWQFYYATYGFSIMPNVDFHHSAFSHVIIRKLFFRKSKTELSGFNDGRHRRFRS